MKLIFQYISRYSRYVVLTIIIKLLGTLSELAIPYILEYLIDDVVPTGNLKMVVCWGTLMFAAAVICRELNVTANRLAISNAHKVSYDVRQDLFEKTVNLTGPQFDEIGLPSLISRMTSDSYNVQSAVQQLQSLCVRSPIMLIGGVLVTILMDVHLAMVLLVVLPFLLAVVLIVSAKGLPIYARVQEKLDHVVRIMRENITGIRVVKALSKEEYEKHRFELANEQMTKTDVTAATVMAVPGPFMQLCLNTGLAAVVIVGAGRVNSGLMKPGVILSFLTYFNMLAMGVMGLSRIFMTMSKASASANRIADVLLVDTVCHTTESLDNQSSDPEEIIRFEHVDFSYGKTVGSGDGFHGKEREKALSDISFSLRKGESLGIIAPTGAGKTTIVNLLMRFYDVDSGRILVNGKDVRSYEKDKLRAKFGAAFQNDMIFQDTLYENVDFGRNLPDADIRKAVHNAMAEEFVNNLDGGLGFEAAIRGANLSGGQKQRILVARALASAPEVLILDDSSSALDYRTDAAMRKAISSDYPESTLIMIAQRVSSIMNMTNILVLDNGRCTGYGPHEQLLNTCPAYREIYEIQMGSMQ